MNAERFSAALAAISCAMSNDVVRAMLARSGHTPKAIEDAVGIASHVSRGDLALTLLLGQKTGSVTVSLDRFGGSTSPTILDVRAAEVLALAERIGMHWRDQQGVNGALLDQLAELTR